jgi:hypothetical protein
MGEGSIQLIRQIGGQLAVGEPAVGHLPAAEETGVLPTLGLSPVAA